jgi:hypothetical protein
MKVFAWSLSLVSPTAVRRGATRSAFHSAIHLPNPEPMQVVQIRGGNGAGCSANSSRADRMRALPRLRAAQVQFAARERMTACSIEFARSHHFRLRILLRTCTADSTVARPRNHCLSVSHRETAHIDGNPNLAIASPFRDLRRGPDSNTCQPQAMARGLYEAESVAVTQHAIPLIPLT